jgi:hypothetical protein
VGSPTTLPSTSLASLATTYGRTASSRVSVFPAGWMIFPSRL